MNWFAHEYLVPIIIGGGKEQMVVAKTIRRLVGVRPIVFAQKLGLSQRFYASLQKISPISNHTLLLGLCDFAETVEEYKLLVLIYGKDNLDFITNNKDELESRFIICNISQANKLLNGVNNDT